MENSKLWKTRLVENFICDNDFWGKNTSNLGQETENDNVIGFHSPNDEPLIHYLYIYHG